MISRSALVLVMLSAWINAAELARASCIQPSTMAVTIVHEGLRLVEITAPAGAESVVIERSASQHQPIWLELRDGTRVTRLRLEPEETIRFGGDGPWSQWVDPLTLAPPPAPEAVQTPGWALGAVWYNIFPERFDDGEPWNNQGWPHGTPLGWGQDWFEVSADEFEASANRAIASPGRYGDDHRRNRPPLNDAVFERRFGGDLEGVIRRMDHIAGLGASVIWFCPIFDATSLHKYDATDHRHVDPSLAGTRRDASRPAFSEDPSNWDWTEADRVFLDGVLPAAHERGLRVVLDGVWNHVGLMHPAFVDAATRGPASPYFDWFEIVSASDGKASSWRAWDRRNGGLPVFRQEQGTLSPGPRAHVEAVTRRWMDPNGDGDSSDGIDGWRLDVANEVPLGFWTPWRESGRSINPEATLVGELWFDGADYFGGKAFDSQMNYPLAFAVTAWLGRDPGFDSADLVEALDRVYRHHPATDLAQVNLLSSHDTPRLASMLANPGDEYDRGAELGATGFDRGQPSEAVFDRVELGFCVLTALPGSPMVYNGEELGMWGGDDPENRKPMMWPDLAPWRGTPMADHAQDMTERVGRWLRLRSDPVIGAVLRHGTADIHASEGLLLIDRQLDTTAVRLIANPTDKPIRWTTVEVPARSAVLQWRSGDQPWSRWVMGRSLGPE